MATESTIKGIKKAARELFKLMPKGGRQGSKKGAKGFERHPKHKGKGWQ
jgi:hypothetical protein